MKTGKRILAIFLSLLMVVLLIPFASAEDGEMITGQCGESIFWSLNDQGKLSIFGNGKMQPEMIEFHESEEDGGGTYYEPSYEWFQYRNKVKKIEIENGITDIGLNAFEYFRNLTDVSIPNSVKEIKNYAFYCCKSLLQISIPDGVEMIGYNVFGRCDSLETVSIGSGLSQMGDAFAECYSLHSFYVSPNNTSYCSDDGVIYNKDKTGFVQFPLAKTELTIPNTVEYIGWRAFQNCTKLSEVTIPDSVTEIAPYAFYGCSGLNSITIPNSVTKVGWDAFSCCSALRTVVIGSGVAEIGEMAFSYCESLKAIDVVANNATYCSVDGVLYDKARTILIQIPLAKTRVFVADGTITIAERASESLDGESKLESVVISDTVEQIGDFAFRGCRNLESVTIGNGLVSIGKEAFSECNMTSIAIPKSIINIYRGAFLGCSSLSDVYYAGTEEEWNGIAIDSLNESLMRAMIHFGYSNIYNLGEETYSFENFIDNDSYGHCFGMSSTSSMYYLGLLNLSTLGGNADQTLNSFVLTDAVRAPICHYQAIQGSYSRSATVAGGSYYLSRDYNIESDWNAVVNYVKDHNYDGKGNLQIGFRKADQGGHAINFLRYESVDGQERIYAYDNNFPTIETYFYRDSSGRVWQAPYSTFGGAIDCIALRDVSYYYSLAEQFDATHVIYAAENSISIDNAEVSPMECDLEDGEYFMYEIPPTCTQVEIVPRKDDAAFTYMDHTYQFGQVNNDTYGVITLSKSDEGTPADASGFTIHNAPEATHTHTDADNDGYCDTCDEMMEGGSHCPKCGKIHNGNFFDKLTGFFHKIIYRLTHLFKR